MKQYLDKDQTVKLIELGFPKPKFLFPIEDHECPDYIDDDENEYALVETYSIGELIEFLPMTIDWTPRIIRENKIEYSFGIEESELYYSCENDELIDNLFDMCVRFKKDEIL